MRRNASIYLALALLIFAGSVDGWDWWITHDVEVFGLLGRAPLVGSSISATLGADDTWEHVTIAVDASYPPFASLDANGKMVGFEVDLASALGNRIASRADLVNMDAGDALFDALTSDKVDAIVAGLTYFPDVTRDVAYSEPYFEAGPVLLVSASRTDIRGVSDLAGKRVAVEMGSVGEGEARRVQKDTRGMVVAAKDDVEQAIASAGDGSADAAIVDRASIPPGSMEKAGVRPVGPPLRAQPYMVAVKRKNRALLLAINRALDSMKADGSLATMEKRWFP